MRRYFRALFRDFIKGKRIGYEEQIEKNAAPCTDTCDVPFIDALHLVGGIYGWSGGAERG